jgi:hypothetical protein
MYYRRNTEVLVQRIDKTVRSRTAIFPEDAEIALCRSGKIYAVNSVGSRVWELLSKDCTALEISEEIQADFNVTKETSDHDVESFLSQLLILGFVILDDTKTATHDNQ